MRSVFSFRFLAAIGAVVILLLILSIAFGSPVPIVGQSELQSVFSNSDTATGPRVEKVDDIQIRRIDFIDVIAGTDTDGFEVVDHLAIDDVGLVIDGERTMFIKVGTPGEDYCGRLYDEGVNCAVVADLLGEAVVWFALVPAEASADDEPQRVRVPAIDELVDGWARLVNGWELPYDPVLKRLCVNDDNPATQDEFDSYREFRETLGANFTALYEIRQFSAPSRLAAVECRTTLPYTWDSIRDARLRYLY